MPNQKHKDYSIMDSFTLNTLIKAEVQAWAIDLRVKHGGEYMLKIIKALPYDAQFGVTLAAIVADLKANWRREDPNFNWGRRDEELAVQDAIRNNKACKKRLGRGAFSSVFLMEDGRVLKINCNKTDYDSWLNWATECRNSEYNPFMPQIYGIDVFDTTYAAFTELLTPWDESVLPYSAFNGMANRIQEYPMESWKKIEKYPVYDPYASKDHYLKISQAIGRVIQSVVGSRVDLHSDNVMFRGRQLVFTDPIAWGRPPTDSILYTRAQSILPKLEASKLSFPIAQPLVGDWFEAWQPKAHKVNPLIANWIDKWKPKDCDVNPKLPFFGDMDINLMYPHVIKPVRLEKKPPKLPEIKIRDNGKRFGLSLFNAKEARNLRFLTPQPWFREQEVRHNNMYNLLMADLEAKGHFAVGEPPKRQQMKILKGRQEVDVQGAQAP